MTQVRLSVLLLALAALATPAAAQGKSGGADLAQFRVLNQKWADTITAKDLSGVLSFYSADGVIMPTGVPAAKGRAALAAVWGELLKAPGLKAKLVPVEVEVSASRDLAMDRGAYELTTDGPSGPVTEKGKYLVVWKKVSGEWKVAADMFSKDAP